MAETWSLPGMQLKPLAITDEARQMSKQGEVATSVCVMQHEKRRTLACGIADSGVLHASRLTRHGSNVNLWPIGGRRSSHESALIYRQQAYL